MYRWSLTELTFLSVVHVYMERGGPIAVGGELVSRNCTAL